MNWDDVIRADIAALNADTALRTLLGLDYAQRIKRTADGTLLFPSVTYFVVTGSLDENTEAIEVQWDIWTRAIGAQSAYSAALSIEARIRAVFHRTTVTTIGGIKLWTEVSDHRDHEDPESGVVHRSLDIVQEFARAVA